ncbi:MAG: signal peptide peptidase SppA [Bacteroidetes bacterium]|nr:signal peptide peptidase SppA [Bacteroidota bacterium]
MKQFFKFFFASMLGFIIGSIVLFFIFIAILAGIVSSTSNKKTVELKEKSILKITLAEPVTERTPSNPFKNWMSGEIKSNPQPGLYDIVKLINKSGADENISGLYINVSDVSAGMASLEEIRNALVEFKKSKKFVVAYSEFYSQKGYYLASVADEIYLHPEGGMEWKGMGAQLLFFKNMFEKIGVEPQIIRHGKFKSAIEPLIAEKMSDENRAQMKALIDDLWRNSSSQIAKSRGKTYEEFEMLADSLAIETPADAVKYGLVTKTIYEDEVLALLKKKSNATDQPKFISMERYANTPEKNVKYSANKIALVFANGDINSGKGNDESIGSETLAETLRKARTDEKVKAVVFRVNSPGGSALASDVIWREIELTRKVKPVVVSMGDFAASGGYYISCAANKIYAHQSTITGSIGVFGVMFNAQKLMEEKLGVTTDTYKTSDYSDIGSIARPLTAAERNKVQRSVEEVYETFTSRVADGRHIIQADVDSLGQGRVWSGEDALQLKLIDAFGGIQDAIKEAASLAKLSEYRISELPIQKDPFMELLQDGSEDVRKSIIKAELGENASYYQSLKKLMTLQGVQARLPFELKLD